MSTAFRCPVCGCDNFRTEGSAYSGTGLCKGRTIYRDAKGDEVPEEQALFRDYAGCTFRWSRRDEARYFVGEQSAARSARAVRRVSADASRCPACVYEQTVRDSIREDPLGEEDPDLFAFAWCMGAAHALAATAVDKVFQSFGLCQLHGRTVVEAMGDFMPQTPNTKRTH